MIKNFYFSLLSWLFLLGVSMPLFAGEAHPNGPEDRPFAERTIQTQGKARNIFLTLAFPKPDHIVDWAPNGFYSAADPFPYPLTLTFDYTGYFWQGVFGRVGFDVKINKRKPDLMPWTDLESLLQDIRIQMLDHNLVTKNDTSENHRKWEEPSLSQLNGIPCVQQYVSKGNHSNAERHYYFLFEDDYALEVIIEMVDNSTRPGLTQSDWRPRAEAFGTKLLSTVKVRIEQVR
jgi:hypothetical protein